MNTKTLKVHTYQGIGDFSWVYSKLVTTGRKLHIIYYRNPRGATKTHDVQRRCEPFLELLPAVESWEFSNKIDPKTLNRHRPTVQEVLEGDKTIFALNHHLESGSRIEAYVPQIATNFHYPINIPQVQYKEATKQLGGIKDYLLIYASKYASVNNWKGWKAREWSEFIKLYREQIADVPVVLTGATYDTDLASYIAGPNILNLVGKTTMGGTIELIKRSRYFISFPSGLAVLATVVKKPVYMFYPPRLGKLRAAWASPAALADHSYLSGHFAPPQTVIDTIKRLAPK